MAPRWREVLGFVDHEYETEDVYLVVTADIALDEEGGSLKILVDSPSLADTETDVAFYDDTFAYKYNTYDAASSCSGMDNDCYAYDQSRGEVRRRMSAPRAPR